MLQNISR